MGVTLQAAIIGVSTLTSKLTSHEEEQSILGVWFIGWESHTSSTVVAWADLVAGSFWPLYGPVSTSCWLTDVGPASRQTVRRSCDVNRPCGLCLPTVLSLHLALPALRIECDASS